MKSNESYMKSNHSIKNSSPPSKPSQRQQNNPFLPKPSNRKNQMKDSEQKNESELFLTKEQIEPEQKSDRQQHSEVEQAFFKKYGINPKQYKQYEQTKEINKFIKKSGIQLAFRMIFNEIVQKGIPEEKVFEYCREKLLEYGKHYEQYI